MASSPKFHALLDKMRETHDRKNHDYAKEGNPFSNFEEAAAYAGVTVQQVFNVLIGIKQARLVELLTSGKKPQNESIEDTLLDRAVYSALAAAYGLGEPQLARKTITIPSLPSELRALRAQREWCGSMSKPGLFSAPWACTRPMGHEGPHMAIDSEGKWYGQSMPLVWEDDK